MRMNRIMRRAQRLALANLLRSLAHALATGNQTPGQLIAGLYRRAAHILRTGKRLPPLKIPSVKKYETT
jgi:hypothetical protein